MSEPAQKCVNNSISNQNYAQKLFIAFKMAYSCRCGLRGNLDFPDFLQKSFITLATGSFSLLLSLSLPLSLSLSLSLQSRFWFSRPLLSNTLTLCLSSTFVGSISHTITLSLYQCPLSNMHFSLSDS